MFYFPRMNSKTQTLTRNQSTVFTERSCVSIATTSVTISGWGLTSRGLTNCYRITISGSCWILLAYTRLKPTGSITHNYTYNIFHTSYFALATFLAHKNVISRVFITSKMLLRGPQQHTPGLTENSTGPLKSIIEVIKTLEITFLCAKNVAEFYNVKFVILENCGSHFYHTK
jgi:hypothetical protein